MQTAPKINTRLTIGSFCLDLPGIRERNLRDSGPIRLASHPLNWDALRREDLVLQREHARGGFVDATHERDRPLEDRFEAFAILEARLWIFVLDDQVGVR